MLNSTERHSRKSVRRDIFSCEKPLMLRLMAILVFTALFAALFTVFFVLFVYRGLDGISRIPGERGLALVIAGAVLVPVFAAAIAVNARVVKKHVILPMRALAKEAQAASQTKSAFLTNMSHEFRTPMNAVIGMSELLLSETLSERQKEYVGDIITSAHSMLDIISDILDLSKIEAGRLTLIPADYDFHAFLDNIGSMFSNMAGKKGIEFRLEYGEDIPRYLFGDDMRLKQVLANICGNAVKFTGKGYVSLKVADGGGLVVFEVKDTGIGIQREDIPKLFSAFEQSGTAKSHNLIGTGLGLAITKLLVEMMDGDITLDSEYGQGTVVFITIPVKEGVKENIRKEEKPPAIQSFSAPSARVLIVDDNEFNLKVAHGLLALLSINAELAYSGHEALEKIRGGGFDIVFMDHMMPEMDGVQATAEIRKLGGKYRELPVVALTANTIQGAKEMFLANGLNGFVPKPIKTAELYQALLDFLPTDKIIPENEPPAPRAAPETGDDGLLELLNGIGGINTETGLGYASGIWRLYREAVELFYKKIESECAGMAEALDGGDIARFAISIHAMKSVLSTVGAAGLSEAALKMEMAAKDGDIGFCAERYPGFRKSLLDIRSRLSAAFTAAGTPETPKEKGDDAYLRENVQKAIDAAADFDGDAGAEAVNGLLAYDFGDKTGGLLEKALEAFNGFDCDKAIEFLSAIE